MYWLDRLCPDRAPGFRHKSYLRPTRLGKKWPATFRGEVIGRDQLELWARGVETFPAAIPPDYGALGVEAFSAAQPQASSSGCRPPGPSSGRKRASYRALGARKCLPGPASAGR